MKKVLCIILAAVLCVGCGNNANQPNTETEINNKNTENVENTENEDSLAYAQAYIDVIRAYESSHAPFECKYSLIYLNDDDVPELVAGQFDDGLCVSLYTYDGGVVHTLINDWAFGMGGNPGYEYAEGKNIIYNENADYAGLVNCFTYWKINDKYELEEYYTESLISSGFEDKDGNGIPSEDEYLEDYAYFYGDKEITEEEFNSYKLDGEYELIEGEFLADTIIRELEEILGSEENSTGEDVSKKLSASEYQNLCGEMMDSASAYGSDYEKMAVHMARIMTDADVVAAGDAYRMSDMSETDKVSLELALVYYEFKHEPVYGLTSQGENMTDYVVSIYNKEELKNIMSSFCEGGTIDGLEGHVVDYGDSIGVVGADGDPWEYFDAYDIKENDNYVLIHAACYYGHNGGADNVYNYTANMLFEKATDSIFGLRLVYVEGYNHDLTQNIISITASSQLADQGSKTYGPSNLIDKRDETAWVENTNGVGIGENLVIKLNGKIKVQEVGIRNGYQASEDICGKNGYVTRFSVDFGNGVIKEVSCYGGFDYGEKNLCKVSLEKPVYTDTIIITILDAKAGSKYSDTCISEIEIH